MARSRADLRLLILLLLATPACDGGEAATSILLDVAVAPGVTEVPEELRVYVQHDAVPLYEDQRLPKAGKLLPVAMPELGSISIELDSGGTIDIDVYGLRSGARRFIGHVQAHVANAEQTRARLELTTTTRSRLPR